jgi:hypothetical protein
MLNVMAPNSSQRQGLQCDKFSSFFLRIDGATRTKESQFRRYPNNPQFNIKLIIFIMTKILLLNGQQCSSDKKQKS